MSEEPGNSTDEQPGMERGLYTSATGMSIAEKWMDVISHNLANASTTGFKRDVLIFNEGLERTLRGQSGDLDSLGSIGAGPGPKGIFTVWEEGHMTPTGNPLDIAVANQKALFAIETPNGTQYTRDGALSLNTNRELVTKSGGLVLDTSGNPIQLPPGQAEIARDGSISVNARVVGRIALFTGEFQKVGNNNYQAVGDTKEVERGEVDIQQGFVEGSNVNVVEEMVAMIKLNRAFEMAQKSAVSQDEATSNLLRTLSGQ